MKKKVSLMLSILLVVALVMSCISCTGKTDLNMLFLGDSIIEGLIGPGPLSEREAYAYYSVIGQRNNYQYINRAVGGHTTKDLLDIVNKEDEGAFMTQTHIKNADVIAISIIGNDFLMNGLNDMILGLIEENTTLVEEAVVKAKANFENIIKKIKELNSDVKLMVQTIYNPFYIGSTLLPQATLDILTAKGYDEAAFRALGAKLLNFFNGIILDYNVANPNSYHIIDVYSEFDRVSKLGVERGKDLISVDWIHPSSEGHSVIADLYQAKLEELNLAKSKKAVSEYKKIRVAQLDRLYGSMENLKAVKKSINGADTCANISEIYFNAIDGITPNYLDGKIAQKKGKSVKKEQTYKINLKDTEIMGIQGSLLFDKTSGITLKRDGTMNIKFILSDTIIAVINNAIGGMGIDSMINDFGSGDVGIGMLGDMNKFLSNMFPGINMEDVPAAMEIVKRSLGISVVGLDLGAIEGGSFTIPKGFGIEFNGSYSLEEVKNSKGEKFTAVHVGTYTKNTQPYFLMSIDGDNISFNFEMVKLHVKCGV